MIDADEGKDFRFLVQVGRHADGWGKDYADKDGRYYGAAVYRLTKSTIPDNSYRGEYVANAQERTERGAVAWALRAAAQAIQKKGLKG